MSRQRAGRKRKKGERGATGRLKPSFDQGTTETRARRLQYAGSGDPVQTVDAIGRAWCAGLLDLDGRDGLAMRDRARAMASLYWRKLPSSNSVSGLYRNMISGHTDEMLPGVSRTMVIEDADERDARQEAALLRDLRILDQRGLIARQLFDQMVVDVYPDCGPPWLDALIVSKREATLVAIRLNRDGGLVSWVDCILGAAKDMARLRSVLDSLDAIS
jgi:hypothetical protein